MQLIGTIKLVLGGLNRRLRILGILMTMYDSRTNLSAQVVGEVRSHFPNEIFNTLISRSVRLSEAPSYGLTILEYDPNSRGALAYSALAREVVERTTDDRRQTTGNGQTPQSTIHNPHSAMETSRA
jgi:chromosome partitioning protein